MAHSASDIDPLIRLLSDKASARRRSAAKRLRKLKDPKAGPALLAALENEVRDPRTWETQYHMIMAIGESGCVQAVPFLRRLSTKQLEPMVLTALGDALVRLGRSSEDDPTPLMELLETNNLPLVEGGIRAVAMLHLKPTPDAVHCIINYASRPGNEQVRFWVAAAAPGWAGPEVETFLREGAHDHLADTTEAAEAALQKKYLTWHPL